MAEAKVIVALRREGATTEEMLESVQAAVPALDGVAGAIAVYLAERPSTRGPGAVVTLHDVTDVEAAIAALRTPFGGRGTVDAYAATEHFHWDVDRSAVPVGTPEPDVFQISFLRAKDGLSPEEFAVEWLKHKELAKKHHPTLTRYRVNTLPRPLTDGAVAYDGIAELAFPSAEDIRDRMFDSEEGQRVIAADVDRFIDMRAGIRLVGPRVVLKP